MQHPQFTSLNKYAILRVSGEDASTFLQGQFGNDVAQVSNAQHQLNCYSNPKGRLISIFRLFQSDADYYLRMPQDNVDYVLKRLRMFIMRAKVTIDPTDHIGLGLFGATADTLCGNLFADMPAPMHVGAGFSYQGISVLRVPGAQIPRYEIYGTPQKIDDLTVEIERHNGIKVDEGDWYRDDIRQGLANVYADTCETFIAQMLNLQLVDGISFSKGCFPGQEIIARLRYLGKLKRRMYLACLNSAATIQLGENLFTPETTQPVGSVADAIAGDPSLALVVLDIQLAETQQHFVTEAGTELTLTALPYQFDPPDTEK